MIKGDAEKVIKLVGQGLDSGKKPSELLEQGLLNGMNVIGKRFKAGEIFIPEVLLAARAMKAGMHLIEPLLSESDASPRGTLVIGTVQGDLHDIGKNLAGIMFRGAGFNVVDLGVDVSADKFLKAAKEHNPEVIGLSALLTTTMVKMGDVVKVLRGNGVKSTIVVGGAPITQEYADSINADVFAPSAADGVDRVLAQSAA